MNDTEFQKLLRQTDRPAESAQGLKEAQLIKIFAKSGDAGRGFSGLERFLFTRPLQAAGIVSVVITGAVWSVFGSAFPALISGLIG